MTQQRPHWGWKAMPSLAALLCLCASALHAGDMLDARFKMIPEQPFVNQPFELHLFIRVSPGVELQDLSLDGIPGDAFATIQPFQAQARTQEKQGNGTVDVLHYLITGRAIKPWHQDIAAIVRASVVERKTLGFFSSINMNSAAIHAQPFRLEFRALPPGLPQGFAGAVGSFSLSGHPSATRVSPGDIVTIEYQLTGSGWLGQASLVFPDPGPGFRTYPPQELKRDESGTLTVREVVIPLTTHSTQTGTAYLPYFDPVTGAYREASAGPFNLVVVPSTGGTNIPAIKRVDIQSDSTTPAEANAVTTASAVWHARRLAPFAALFLLAMLVAGGLYTWKPRIAIATGIVIFLVGIYLTHRWIEHTEPPGRELRETTAARLCPSANARILFRVAMGQQVVPVETMDGWVRVETAGQYGWIPVSALK